MKNNLIGFAFVSLSLSAQAQTDLDRVLFESGKKEMQTDAAIIQVDGKIVYERYGNGYSADKKHISWSTVKATTGILMGIAAEKGLLKLSDPVSKWIPEYKDSGTILDFLHMSSNIQFTEVYDGVPVGSDVVKMLYLNGPKAGFAAYTSSLPLRTGTKPGDHFYYSSGDSNVLMEVLKRATGDTYNSFPWDEYFAKLGIDDATLEQDAHGTFVGSSYLYLTARDFVKLGQLVTQKGVWGRTQVIPKSYFKLMNTVAPGAGNAIAGASTSAYSVHLKTNQPIPSRGLPSLVPELPLDALYIFGHQGQVMIMLPSTKTVMLRLGTDQGWPLDDAGFFLAARKYLADRGLPVWAVQQVVGTPRRDEEAEAPAPDKNFLQYLKVPKLIRTLGAKELCSCVFVLKRDLKTCKKDMRVQLPVNPVFIVNEKKKTVRTTFVIEGAAEARFVSDRLGCQLVH